jgi:hypothetical protein
MTQDPHQNAFEYYRSLGPKRSYRRVAGQFGVSVSSIKAWAQAGRWQDKITERDAQIARETADRTMEAGVQENERNLKIVRMALLQLAKDISERKIKGQLSDVDRLIRLEEYLRGADTRACRDPAHKPFDEIQTVTDPNELKRRWIENTLRVLELMPDATQDLWKELTNRGLTPHSGTRETPPHTGV